MSSIRRGIPHLHSEVLPSGNSTPSLSVMEFKLLTLNNHVHLFNITEKTDGLTFLLGWDWKGFYTKHSGSGSDKAYCGADHVTRALMRSIERGVEYDATFASSISDIHDTLCENFNLMQYMHQLYKTHGVIEIRGELYNRKLGKINSETGDIKFVHTYYNQNKIGTLGTFVLHTQLEDNKHIDYNKLISVSNKYVIFDHDMVEFEGVSVSVTAELEQFYSLNHDLIMSRTTKRNKSDKVAENEKFNQIKSCVGTKVTSTLAQIGVKNKWGPGSEGIVVHPSDRNTQAPRFKVVTPAFKQAKIKSERF